MLAELNRRAFLKLVFSSVAAVSIPNFTSPQSSAAIALDAQSEAELYIDENGYIVDTNFNYYTRSLPSRREYFGLINLCGGELKKRLDDLYDDFYWMLQDPDNWKLEEITPWLDDDVRLEELSPRNAMVYTEFGPAIDFYEELPWPIRDQLQLKLIEGEYPGHNFVGVKFNGDVDILNAKLKENGINLFVYK